MSLDLRNIPIHSSEDPSISFYDKNGNSTVYVGNRIDQSGVRCIPILKIGSLSDICLSAPYVSYKFGYPEKRVGLKDFVCIPKSQKYPRMYFVDEHHHAFYCWAEARASGDIYEKAMLIHVDDHGDEVDWPNIQGAVISDLNNAANYTNTVLSEGDFIVKARRLSLVGGAIWVDDQLRADEVDPSWKETDYLKVSIDSKTVGQMSNNNLILDLDLDYFARHLYEWKQKDLIASRGWKGDIDSLLEHDISIIQALIRKAKVVTTATSPGYLQPDLALFLIDKIFSPVIQSF